jgi:APA family basic amino acid/polyamine antiporter
MAAFWPPSFAEIGARLHDGGFFKTYSYCYPPAIAFTLIWIYLVRCCGISAVAYAGAQYIPKVSSRHIAEQHRKRNESSFIVIILFASIFSASGWKHTQNILSSIKIIADQCVLLRDFCENQ